MGPSALTAEQNPVGLWQFKKVDNFRHISVEEETSAALIAAIGDNVLLVSEGRNVVDPQVN